MRTRGRGQSDDTTAFYITAVPDSHVNVILIVTELISSLPPFPETVVWFEGSGM
jgi:hypothetical protein